MSTTLQALKAKSEAKSQEEKRQIDKKREVIILVEQFLQDQGFLNSLESLQNESGCSLAKYQVADNIDLQLIYQHFQEYYEMRFGKPPKVLKKASVETTNKIRKPSKTKVISRSESLSMEAKISNNEENDLGINGTSCSKPSSESETFEQKVMKPLSSFLNGYNNETKELALIISRDIFTDNPNVKWDDVIGLEGAKRLLKEAVVMPLKYPDLFSGALLSPWKGVLLYGPPGTGKTMLAKAVATECKTTFFNISASTIVSKYRGDSEKLIRVLFDLARYHSPSTIFLDEIDSIMGQRGGGEHEASRRMKTELLIQMDGLSRTNDVGVFILAASNLPWELDAALLRRLEKRVLVRLPEKSGRLAVFEKQLPPNDSRTANIDYDTLAEQTQGYSCADVCLVCKEAAMHPIRRLMAKLELVESEPNPNIKLDPVTNDDALKALGATKPSAAGHLEETYLKWQEEFGAF